MVSCSVDNLTHRKAGCQNLKWIMAPRCQGLALYVSALLSHALKYNNSGIN